MCYIIYVHNKCIYTKTHIVMACYCLGGWLECWVSMFFLPNCQKYSFISWYVANKGSSNNGLLETLARAAWSADDCNGEWLEYGFGILSNKLSELQLCRLIRRPKRQWSHRWFGWCSLKHNKWELCRAHTLCAATAHICRIWMSPWSTVNN